eukprot:TRINITY_DN1219_c1_g4_i2.p1 TRINITY_DN1219_c1_g4~~TRINITY_DN1219_c1_g4_i2.p1  ORF type:complete len:416 (+),score=61.96 TRINITY_DN1219_c1_g4_i2:268-1515(+)
MESCVFKPCMTFQESGFPSHLLTQMTSSFAQPTPIQSQCWPILLSKRDIVGIAKTGSGKTLAFGLPGILHVTNTRQRMLVLAPTRELALQTEAVLKISQLKVVCVYGGAPMSRQREALAAGVDVVVATPGRLLSFIESGDVDLSNVSYLVLDEADRMLDMGFELDITKILSYLPPVGKRQTAMFSATWPLAIQKVAAKFLDNPVRVTIDCSTNGKTSNTSVTQIVEVIEQHMRDKRLLELLSKYHESMSNRIIIFVLYKLEAPHLEKLLRNRGYKATSIHSNLNQSQREASLKSFSEGRVPLLIATDVASRGLDIPQVEYVINYSFPLTVEDYVHRIGRTGRAGALGISHTFFQSTDKKLAGELVNVLKEAKQEVPQSLLQWGIAVKKKEPTLGKIVIQHKNNNHTSLCSDDDDE